ncbi:hypothetical protein JVT61DRAFT_1507 [Boletus reticuloceps]|uniref:Uncharacterized protein n=1 Tax=Boletus reticuloceps TaxID=495285 RepID=A0A8I3A204_9AGAM|nr:hypothetical protein JVT61DRAFT_1507 [Boletus reticuloceps]
MLSCYPSHTSPLSFKKHIPSSSSTISFQLSHPILIFPSLSFQPRLTFLCSFLPLFSSSIPSHLLHSTLAIPLPSPFQSILPSPTIHVPPVHFPSLSPSTPTSLPPPVPALIPTHADSALSSLTASQSRPFHSVRTYFLFLSFLFLSISINLSLPYHRSTPQYIPVLLRLPSNTCHIHQAQPLHQVLLAIPILRYLLQVPPLLHSRSRLHPSTPLSFPPFHFYLRPSLLTMYRSLGFIHFR